MNSIHKTNLYILNAKKSVNSQYRLKYHMMPPVGWMNDPNGLVYFNGEYHLYYQFNPYATHPGKMCWGHIVTRDLISSEDCGVALMSENEDESIFSGGAIQTKDILTALYTLHTENERGKTEEVYLATSVDGSEFSNTVKAFDNKSLPTNLSCTDFRDPCPVKVGDEYYVFVGGKDVEQNKGGIIVLGGRTLKKLEYKFCLGPYYELGEMGECPSYFKIDGKDVIVVSGCRVCERDNDFKNRDSSVFIVGNLDFKKGIMNVDFVKEIDKGDTFYAPQFIRGSAYPIIVGWFEMWNKSHLTNELGHGWVGAFTIPRRLEIKDGDIYQTPVQSLASYHYEPMADEIPKCADISFEFVGDGALTIGGTNGKIVIVKNGNVYMDIRYTNNLNNCIRRTNLTYNRCKVRLLLDISGAELFVDGGREVISSRIYIDGDYRIGTLGGVKTLKIKGIQTDTSKEFQLRKRDGVVSGLKEIFI